MGTASTSPASPTSDRILRRAAWLLLALGLLGHVYAAYAMGGSTIAYTHHIFGFGLILLVTGGLIALVARRFWPSRWALTLLIIGLVQSLFGLWVALHPIRAAAHP